MYHDIELSKLINKIMYLKKICETCFIVFKWFWKQSLVLILIRYWLQTCLMPLL